MLSTLNTATEGPVGYSVGPTPGEKGPLRMAEPASLPPRRYLDLAHDESVTKYKAAEALAFTIGRDIIGQGKERHEFLGSEPELIERYGISRAVFREAVRILEYHSWSRPGAGREAGSTSGTRTRGRSRRHAMFLEFERVEPQQLHETRSVLELHAIELATSRLDEAGEGRLREVAAADGTDDPMGYIRENDFHRTVCELAGNRPLTLFVEVTRTAP